MRAASGRGVRFFGNARRLFCSETATPTQSAESKSKSALLHSLSEKTDTEIAALVASGKVPAYALEQALKKSVKMGAEPDCTRAVRIRRSWVAMKAKAFDDLDEERSAKEAFDTASVPQVDKSERTEGEGVAEVAGGAPIEVPKVPEDYPMHTIMSQLPYDSFDHDNFYRTILGQNCEMVIGFVPLPVGVVGPLVLDGKHVQVPMATTEGALVASTNRGCRAIAQSGGATASVFGNGMTRAPVLRLPSAAMATELKLWIEDPENFAKIKDAFESTSRFAKLLELPVGVAGQACPPAV